MKTPPQLDHKRISTLRRHPLQHRLLRKRMLQLLMRQHMSFRDRLERKQILRRLMPHQQHFTRTPLAQDTHHDKVVDDDFALGFLGLLDDVLLVVFRGRRMLFASTFG